MRYGHPLTSRPTSRLLVVAATISAAAAIAACGSNSASSASSNGEPSQAQRQQMQQDAVRFADCMRTHGVPTFPDPTTSPVEFKNALGAQTPAFKSAATVCRHLLPNRGPGSQETAQQTHARLADALSFARCVRGQGVARFPDPTAQGDLSVEMVRAQGIDVRSPAFLRAVQTCLPASHGWLTPAKVRAALNNAGG